MKYSDETIESVRVTLLRSPARERLITLSNQALRETAKQILEALESTDDMKALRADAESHRMRMKNCDCQQEGLCHYCRTGEERGA